MNSSRRREEPAPPVIEIGAFLVLGSGNAGHEIFSLQRELLALMCPSVLPMSKPSPLTQFSDHLFWDTPMESVDAGRNRKWLVKRVLEKGTKGDWDRLLGLYGKDGVAEAVRGMRSLEKKPFRFACAMLDLEPNECRCYTNRLSHVTHWTY